MRRTCDSRGAGGWRARRSVGGQRGEGVQAQTVTDGTHGYVMKSYARVVAVSGSIVVDAAVARRFRASNMSTQHEKKATKRVRQEQAQWLESLQATTDDLQTQLEEVRADAKQTKKKVGFLCKGQYVVVEGSERVEKAYVEEVEGGGGGFRAFVDKVPEELVQEVAEALGLVQSACPPSTWEVASERSDVQKEDMAALKVWFTAVSAPRSLVNVQPTYVTKKGEGKGKEKGKKGKGKAKGKGKGKDKGKDRAGKERKPKCFVLQLSAGLRALESKSVLEEHLENRLREQAGLVVTKRAREKPAQAEQPAPKKVKPREGDEAVDSVVEGLEAVVVDDDVEKKGEEKPAKSPEERKESAARSSVPRKRFLLYVEKTQEEREARAKAKGKGADAPAGR